MPDKSTETGSDTTRAPWQREAYEALIDADIRQMSYVPDAGHAELIRLLSSDDRVQSVSLTTEEEGVPMACGAWLAGQRSVLLMQSSGVGNCINAFSLLDAGRFPFLTIVTMRGEWGEFNQWQVPMGSKTRECFELMGFLVYRVDSPVDVASTIEAAVTMAFEGDQRIAVLLSQKLIGKKNWGVK